MYICMNRAAGAARNCHFICHDILAPQMVVPGCDRVQAGFIENGTLRQDICYSWREKGEELARFVQSY